jgi:hypothetical protein
MISWNKGWLTLALLLLSLSVVQAHDWSSRVLIHDWYPESCCGGHDCRPVPCDEIIELPNNTVQWQQYNFMYNQVHPSKDSKCHVCIHKNTGYSEFPVCVFTQQSY